MTVDELRKRLLEKKPSRVEVARATGLKYMYLSRVAWGEIKNPGAAQVDKLRAYYARQDRA